MVWGKLVRWGAIALGGAALAALLFVGWVYAASEMHLRSFASPPPFDEEIFSDAATLARGEHLVATRGCRGCHGAKLEGEMMWGVAAAPNLPLYVREHDAATFERALRHGIDAQGRGLYSMPSFNFAHLRDEDVAAMLAYLRTLAVVEGPELKGRLPFEIRMAIAMGQDNVMPAWLASLPPLEHQGADTSLARGEYLAMTSCNECHGFSLRADVPWGADPGTPDLIAMMAAYPEDDFRRLMREGVPIGGRDLELMDDVARGRFVHFSEEEVGDLYTYLQHRSAQLTAP